MSLDGEKMEDLRIICVSTGTKCVNGEHMSVNGKSLNGGNVATKLIFSTLFIVTQYFKLLVIKTCRVYNIVFMIADCHAEIISRRCLVEFLYKQIEKFENGCPSPLSIFEAKMEQGKSKGYRLKVTIIRSCIHN